MIACRESGEDGTKDHAAYQLGIDGRQALIRIWYEVGQPPKVLARKPLDQPNGKAARLTARCVPAPDGAVALTLLVDGKPAVQTTHDAALPNGAVALHAGARGDTDAPPSLAWDDFVVREVRADDGEDADAEADRAARRGSPGGAALPTRSQASRVVCRQTGW